MSGNSTHFFNNFCVPQSCLEGTRGSYLREVLDKEYAADGAAFWRVRGAAGGPAGWVREQSPPPPGDAIFDGNTMSLLFMIANS